MRFGGFLFFCFPSKEFPRSTLIPISAFPLLSCSAGVRHPDAPALARPLPPVVKEEQVIPLMLGVNFSLTFLSVNLFLLSLSPSLPLYHSTESLSGMWRRRF